MKAGRMPRVNNWVNKIPNEVCKSHPKLLFAKCTSLYHMNQPDEAEGTLSILRENHELTEQGIREHISIIEAGIAISRDDIDKILPPLADIGVMSSDFDNGTICNIRGYALSELSEYGPALQSLNDARHYHRQSGSPFGVVYADCFLGFIDLARGNLQKCYDRFVNYEDEFGKLTDMYVASVPSIMQGIVLCEWNELEKALELLLPSLPIIEKVGHTKLLSMGYISLAKIYGARDDRNGVSRFFDRIYNVGESRGVPYLRLRSLVESERIRYLIGSHQINEAIDISSSMGIDIDNISPALPDKWERISCLNLLIWSRLQIATGLASRSLPILNQLCQLAEKVSRYKRVVEYKILQATAFARLNETAKAERVLITALELTIPTKMIRAYLDEDPALVALLENISNRTEISANAAMTAYLNQILKAYSQDDVLDETVSQTVKVSSIVETLSPREIAILELIADGKSNHVIADSLSISQNTVKWHVKNIFGKLSVNKRAAAIVAAIILTTRSGGAVISHQVYISC
jgi:LuxR family maltose regulon positive regulatory protein